MLIIYLVFFNKGIFVGEVQMSKNGGSPTVLMHIDQSLTLWAFLDVYGSTQKIRVLGSSVIELPRPGMYIKTYMLNF